MTLWWQSISSDRHGNVPVTIGFLSIRVNAVRVMCPVVCGGALISAGNESGGPACTFDECRGGIYVMIDLICVMIIPAALIMSCRCLQ